ncbi:MAG TPA: type II toxin-antitoxin system VapC family toxin [Bryobacteraceae bacterium]|jgi:PIN domain nuclease of toxin-antitoxin system|nr:type II toxin-antitoxin system VapC family toxin [Bryobacteraceae bacterium]
MLPCRRKFCAVSESRNEPPLDTHTLIWWLEGSKQLGRHARRVIQDQRNEIWISAASIWEICIKASLKRLDVSERFETELPDEMERSGFRSLLVAFEHAFAVRHLPHHHGDPFDRMLVAQAQCENLTLVTAERIAAYGVPTLDASR